MATKVRRPAVAGRFYPDDPDALRQEVRSFSSAASKVVSALGCVVPHAGYMYSGHVAGAVFSQLTIPDRCILLCPNHTGRGEALSIMSEGEWETPLGTVPIDSALATCLKENFHLLREDIEAHRTEHAAEVELPFLQMTKPDISFVPIALGTSQFEVLQALGRAIADAVAKQSKPVLIIASSDMNHYENDQVTRIKDHKAIEQILALDPQGLFDVVMKEKISMCGFGPTVAMLTAAKKLNAQKTELVKYATSGEISGDLNMVVGYAGVIVR